MHAVDATTTNRKTLDFSALSEFLVGTGTLVSLPAKANLDSFRGYLSRPSRTVGILSPWDTVSIYRQIPQVEGHRIPNREAPPVLIGQLMSVVLEIQGCSSLGALSGALFRRNTHFLALRVERM